MSLFEELVEKQHDWANYSPLNEVEFWQLFGEMLEAKWLEDPPKIEVK